MRTGVHILALGSYVCATAWGEEYRVVQEESIFAVVTHKSGMAASLAHNHLIHAADYSATLSVPDDDPTDAHFTLTFPVSALRVDDLVQQKRWFPKLQAAGILEDPFTALSEKNRRSVRTSMLGDKQLDAERYPAVTATVKEIRERPGEPGLYNARIVMTTHGQAIARDVSATITLRDGHLAVEAIGAFTFSEFGITPFSTLLGSIRNKDRFHVYVNLQAKAVPPEIEAGPPLSSEGP